MVLEEGINQGCRISDQSTSWYPEGVSKSKERDWLAGYAESKACAIHPCLPHPYERYKNTESLMAKLL